MDAFDKLKNLSIHLRQSVSNISQDIFTSYAALMKGSKKSNWPEKLTNGEKYTIILDKIADDKLPSNANAGNFLRGTISFYKDSTIRDVVGYPL